MKQALYEKCRTKTWAEIVGQDKAVRKAQFIGREGWEGKGIYTTGKSGTGKSSVANMIASEFASELYVSETTEREWTKVMLADWVAGCNIMTMRGHNRGR